MLQFAKLLSHEWDLRMVGQPHRNITGQDFVVLLFNSRKTLIPGKIKSKWTRPFLLKQLFPHGAVELKNSEGKRFKVNGQRINLYLGNVESVQRVIEAYCLAEFQVTKRFSLCQHVKSSTTWEEY